MNKKSLVRRSLAKFKSRLKCTNSMFCFRSVAGRLLHTFGSATENSCLWAECKFAERRRRRPESAMSSQSSSPTAIYCYDI